MILSQFFDAEPDQSQRTIHPDFSSSEHAVDSSWSSPLPQPQRSYEEHTSSYPSYISPPSHVTRFQEQQLGVRNSSPTQQIEGLKPPSSGDGDFDNRTVTMASVDYRFNPPIQHSHVEETVDASRHSTMLEFQQSYFSDFAGQQMPDARDSYGGPNRYSADPLSSSSAVLAPPILTTQDMPSTATSRFQEPLDPREVPFDTFDPHDGNIPMSNFDNLGAVLRHRGQRNPRLAAFWVLDSKGKEFASITYEKLASRAEKVAYVIKEKSNLYRGDRVALIYRDSEIIDFAVALLGCFLAGVVAVPMNDVEND